MRLREIFPAFTTLVGEDISKPASGADQTMKLAQQQVKRAQIQKTKSKLDMQQKQLGDITNKPK